MYILATAAQMKELDRTAIEEWGIPSDELMESAAEAVAREVRRKLKRENHGIIASSVGVIVSSKDGALTPEQQRQAEEIRAIVESKNTDPARRAAIFCGPGNNGGDGIAAARLLMGMGVAVRCFLVGDREKMTPDARLMERRLLEAGGRLEDFRPDDHTQRAWLTTCDAVVDALFGIGLKRPVEGDFRTAIRWMNRFCGPTCPVISCDVPSGLNSDTGEVMGEAVHADVTVTFSFAKPGLYLDEGRACSGEIRVADIVPFEVTHALRRRKKQVRALDGGQYILPRRPRTAHKGKFGKVFILAGSEGYTGAPVLAANAAVRTGAGLVYLGVPREIYPIVAVKCDEAMPFPLPKKYEMILEKARSCDVALIGPGLGRSPEIGTLIRFLLTDLNIPVVLDADGINALSGHIDILDKRSALTILTPHDGEFSRLTGCALPIRDRLKLAQDFAAAHDCVLVLKGHATVTASPDGNAWINASGNPGMAKGGSGDVLAGMIAGLLGQKHLMGAYTDWAEMTAAAVFYHGQAGDRCGARLGEYGMTPTDMIGEIPYVLKEHEEH